MKIFVSYSRRDGIINEKALQLIQRYLQGIGKPFVHCLQNSCVKFEQLHVMLELITSHAVLLIDSPAARNSKWVKIELFTARLLFRPIFRIDAKDLFL
jgi:hypothetical protein